MEVVEFVNRLFESREQAHVYHLQSDTYAKHIALEEYYEGVSGLIDSFVESWQGKYMKVLEGYDIIKENSIDKSDTLKYFKDLAEYIEKDRYKSINEEDTFLFNIIDEIILLIYKTLYKLEFLK